MKSGKETYIPRPNNNPLPPRPAPLPNRNSRYRPRNGRQQHLRVVISLDIKQHPHCLLLGLGEPLQQVGQTRHALVRLRQRLERAQVRPVAVDDFGGEAEAPFECCVLRAVSQKHHVER